MSKNLDIHSKLCWTLLSDSQQTWTRTSCKSSMKKWTTSWCRTMTSRRSKFLLIKTGSCLEGSAFFSKPIRSQVSRVRDSWAKWRSSGTQRREMAAQTFPTLFRTSSNQSSQGIEESLSILSAALDTRWRRCIASAEMWATGIWSPVMTPHASMSGSTSHASA